MNIEQIKRWLHSIKRWLHPFDQVGLHQNGLVILISIIIGLCVGKWGYDWFNFLVPLNDILFQFIKVWILPLLLARVILAMIYLVSTPTNEGKHPLLKGSIVILFFTLAISVITLIISQIFLKSDADLYRDTELLKKLGKLLLEKQGNSGLAISFSNPYHETHSEGIIDLIVNTIPDNIFAEFAQNQTADVVFFGIVIGFFYGQVYAFQRRRNHNYKDIFINVLETIRKGLEKSMGWFETVLPVLLIIQVANITHELGVTFVQTMGNFIVSFILVFFVILIISFLVIYYQSRKSIIYVIFSLMKPIILTFFTSDSLNAIPFSILALDTSLKFKKRDVNIITPYLMTLSRFGSVIYLIVATLFVAKLYSKPIGFSEIFSVISMAMISGVATSGPAGIMGLLIPILDMLEMPSEVALVLLNAVDPIIAPFREVITLFPNIAAITLIVNKEKTQITS